MVDDRRVHEVTVTVTAASWPPSNP